MRNRDYRRYQRQLAIERHIKRIAPWFTNDTEKELRDRAVRWFKHPANCSLSCCGNPRRWFGQKTMQERRFTNKEID